MRTIPAAWQVAIEAWSEHARERGGSLSTLRTRGEHLRRCARTIGCEDPWQVDAEGLRAWFDGQPWARETRRGHRSTLRDFYSWAEHHALVGRSPARGLPRVRPGEPRPTPLPDAAYATALAAASVDERLMLRLGAELGLRRMEIAQLHTRDVIEDLCGWSLVVQGKGDRERVLPMPDDLARAVRGRTAGWVFPGECGGHLSPRWVGTLVGRLLPQGWTTHTLRHRFATRAHQASGGDLLVVRELLGHASVETTRRYVATGDAKRRATVAGRGRAPVQCRVTAPLRTRGCSLVGLVVVRRCERALGCGPW